jgi:hypothetical protein
LMADKTFEPAEAELRKALGTVKQRLSVQQGWLWKWLEKIDDLDEMVFKDDRPAWDGAYAKVDSKVVLWMQEQCELAGEGPQEEDGEFPATPGSPRWKALNDLLEAKNAAEEAAEQAKLAIESPPERKRIAAARKRGNVKRSGKTTREC